MNIKKLSQIAIIISLVVIGSKVVLAQKTALLNKSKQVNQLVQLTINGFPSESYENAFKSANGQLFSELRDELVKSFADGIDQDAKLSSAEKQRYKENLPELAEKLSSLFVSKIGEGIDLKKWTKEILLESYSKFTIAEINKLVVFFKKPAGASFLKYNHDVADKAISKSDAPEPEVDLQYAVEMEKFLKSAVGNKFYDTLMKTTAEKINKRIETWRDGFLQGLDRSEFETIVNEYKAKYSTKG